MALLEVGRKIPGRAVLGYGGVGVPGGAVLENGRSTPGKAVWGCRSIPVRAVLGAGGLGCGLTIGGGDRWWA